MTKIGTDWTDSAERQTLLELVKDEVIDKYSTARPVFNFLNTATISLNGINVDGKQILLACKNDPKLFASRLSAIRRSIEHAKAMKEMKTKNAEDDMTAMMNDRQIFPSPANQWDGSTAQLILKELVEDGTVGVRYEERDDDGPRIPVGYHFQMQKPKDVYDTFAEFHNYSRKKVRDHTYQYQHDLKQHVRRVPVIPAIHADEADFLEE